MDTALTIMFWGALALLAYALVAYPALMWSATRLVAARRPGAMNEWPTVSFVIPAHNEEAILAAKLANTLALEYPRERLEVIVASDGSSDRTVEIARQFADEGVRVLDLPVNRGKATTLNAAVEEVTGEVLCLCDANVMFRPDSLRRMVEWLGDARVGAVSGDVRLASEESDFEAGEVAYYRLERPVQSGESRIGSMIGVDGGMYVLRRELFRPLRPDTILDDFVTSMQVIRQGKRIVFEPAAVATENGTPSWRQEFRRRVRVTTGAVQSMKRGMWPPLRRPVEVWQYVSHKPLRWLGPVWLAVLAVSSALLWDEGWMYRGVLFAQGAFYFLAGAAWVWPALRAFGPAGMAFYFTMSHAAMAVGLWKGLVTQPTGRWERTERTAAGASRELEPARAGMAAASEASHAAM